MTAKEFEEREKKEMKVADIKALPNEFNFKSTINPCDIIYHAVKEKHGYKVTWLVNAKHECHFTKETFHRNLINGDFIIMPNEKTFEKVLAESLMEKTPTSEEKVLKLLEEIGNAMDAPYYAIKVLQQNGKEILEIVRELEKEKTTEN